MCYILKIETRGKSHLLLYYLNISILVYILFYEFVLHIETCAFETEKRWVAFYTLEFTILSCFHEAPYKISE